MKITYASVIAFSNLTPAQISQISDLLRELSPQRLFVPEQLRTAIMFGSLRIAIDEDASTKIIGMGLLLFRHTATHSSGLIEDVVVSPAYRGKGIGKGIMNYLIAKAQEFPRHLDALELSSRPSRIEANALYRALGFESRDTNCYRLKLHQTQL